MKIPFKIRFEKYIIPEPNSGCWLWVGAQNGTGYGVFNDISRKLKLAHRISYEMFKGNIPKDMVIDHLCRTSYCVNPDHLEAVTQKTNIARGNLPKISGQYQREKTECPYGHPYSGDNLIVRVGIGRSCRECARTKSREFERKKRAKNRLAA